MARTNLKDSEEKDLWVTYYMDKGTPVLCGVFDAKPCQEDLKSFAQQTLPLAIARGIFVGLVIQNHNDRGTN